MKKIAFILLVTLALAGCDKAINKYKCYEPVYTDAETFRAPATFEAPRSFTENGNIYFMGDHLFVVEPNQGIHFIDNSNPSAPQNVGFLKVMGASGLAIRNNFMYVTALIDLVIVDITSLYNPVEVKREVDIFPTALPLMAKNYPTTTIDKSKGIVTSWNVVETKEETNLEPQWTGCFECEFLTINNFDAGGGGGAGTGISGSFAQMTIMGDYLYVLDNNQLKPYNISNPTNLVIGEEAWLSWDTETIFPYNGYLYLGTTTGMMIYNTNNPASPQYEGAISHARACDPVVVEGNYAYVTVRSGGPCGGDINQLDVVDITDKSNPWLVHSVEMSNPHGVGVDGSTVFVCDGDKGLKIYDASDKYSVGSNLIKRFGDIQATDIIPFNGVAMVIGEDGIYQYDYSDPANLIKLSEIKF